MRRLPVAVFVVLAAAMIAGPASAAFPGRNGLLAVAPLRGAGVLLVKPGAGSERRICAGGPGCRLTRSPRWSSDGQALAFSSSYGGGVSIMYSDGSCLDCQPFTAVRPAFTVNRTLLTAVNDGRLFEYRSDGLAKKELLGGGVSDAVWSAQGHLAVVRHGRVLAGPLGRLRSLGTGSSPSWSPRGSELAVVRGGWVRVLGVTHRFTRRLVKGSAPAWSPNGTSIAFIAAGYRLSVIPARGGRVRGVGHVLGSAVDWQPIAASGPGTAWRHPARRRLSAPAPRS
jgi:dipeptidyl aminopeptidase/acylaminoacyl peptidase